MTTPTAQKWTVERSEQQFGIGYLRDCDRTLASGNATMLETVAAAHNAALDAAVAALKKALEELESPSEYQGEVQDGYSPDPKVIESIRQTLAKLGEGK